MTGAGGVAHRPDPPLRGLPTESDPAPIEDLAVLLRGRRGDLVSAYAALEKAVQDGSPRIIHWESGSANQLSIRLRRP